MPKVSVAVTVSVRRAPLLISLFVVGLAVVSGILIYRSTIADTSQITLGGKHFYAEVVTTSVDRERGLSGRDELVADKAMVFPYEMVGNQCFWMKNMKFAIDILWLDEQNRISFIEHSVDPASYPQNFCHTAKNVVELQAGTTNRLNVKVGDQVDL